MFIWIFLLHKIERLRAASRKIFKWIWVFPSPKSILLSSAISFQRMHCHITSNSPILKKITCSFNGFKHYNLFNLKTDLNINLLAFRSASIIINTINPLRDYFSCFNIRHISKRFQCKFELIINFSQGLIYNYSD